MPPAPIYFFIILNLLSTLSFCFQCDTSCSQCSGPASNQCITCANPADFLQVDGTCKSTCSSPFVSNIQGALKTCDKPCRDSLFLYSNGSCLSHCDYNDITDSNQIRHCQYPCKSDQFYYSNDNTCQDTCFTPYVVETIDEYLQLCNSPCDSPDLFYSKKQKACVQDCPSPYKSYSDGYLNICQDAAKVTLVSLLSQKNQTGSSLSSSNFTSVMSKISDGFARAGDILRPTNRNSVFMVSLAKMVKYVNYMNITLPNDVKQSFQPSDPSFSFSKIFGFSMPSSWSNAFSTYSLPEVFEKNGLVSCYLVNQWSSLSSYLIIFLLGVIFTILEKIAEKGNRRIMTLIFARLRIITRWAFILFLLFNSYDDITFYAILQAHSLEFHSGLDYLSFVTCILTTFAALWVLIKAASINHKVQKTKHQITDINSNDHPELAFYQKWHTFQVLYAGFKPKTLLTQVYLVTSTCRIIVCYLIIGFLYRYPVVQGSLLIGLSGATIGFLVYKRPVKARINFFVIMTFETLILLVNACILIIAHLESTGINEDDVDKIDLLYTMCDILLVVNLLIDIFANLFMYLFLFFYAWKAYKISKTPGLESKLVWLNLLVVPFQNPGMDFHEFSLAMSSANLDKPSIPAKNKVHPIVSENDGNYVEVPPSIPSLASVRTDIPRSLNSIQNINGPGSISEIGSLTNINQQQKRRLKEKSLRLDTQNSLDLECEQQERELTQVNHPDNMILSPPKSLAQNNLMLRENIIGDKGEKRSIKRLGFASIVRKTKQVNGGSEKIETFTIVEEPHSSLKYSSATRSKQRTVVNEKVFHKNR